ncbi:uncharacterized protein [Blastocystis hominis]|uniref:Uncharacterized protein n=1 Tax=Blastocystis hominis TaxID=12968 RepID=D8M5Q7_BLAHO|nr:uncharacterized protein [Blastocystis hominis]CBK23396.2 unnamed protein product [Blastocystis hominis]|eukprot:XP_012897444.1 uncharacterized protein [Blastocystis hominis]
MNTEAYAEKNLSIKARKRLELILQKEIQFILQEAKMYMEHCRRTKLTAGDIEKMLYIYNFDKILGYKNRRSEMQRSFMLLSDKSNDSKIVSVNHIIESEVPELPMETSFKVNWFVVEGNQIQYRKEMGEDDDDSDDSPDVQLLSQSIHSLSFECELYLKKIKSRLYSSEEENTEVFHQLQTDEGLNQICPYLVDWVQSTTQKIIQQKPVRMVAYLRYIIQLIHSLLLNRHLHIVSYVSLVSPFPLSSTSSFPAFSPALSEKRSPSPPRKTTGSYAHVPPSSSPS